MKVRRKLNLTLKSYSQKDLGGHFRSQDREGVVGAAGGAAKEVGKRPVRKIVEMRPPKNIVSAKYMEISRKY